jgi:hypothetical protein
VYFIPLDVCSLVLEMEQEPEFETWIRNRDVNGIRLRLQFGLRRKGVFIDVKHTPYAIIAEVIISMTAGFTFGLLLHFDSPFDDSLGDATRNDLSTR